MSDTIIKVDNLSKRYRIGLQEKKADTFAQQIWNSFKAPVENFKRIKSLGKFQDESESVHWALKDVSFEVKQGEVLGVIGKNGAGKSTLLKILSKITEPTSGRIEMIGRVAALLEVGTGFHPELTGRENIYMNGTILGMTKKEIDGKLDEIIDFSGVEKYIDTPVKFYSSGMRVRLGFSVAAHLEPEILIIDEVLAVGDYEFQQKCLGKMEDVSQKEGRTVLFVSHNMDAVRNLCNRSVLLNEGKVRIVSETSETLNFYLAGEHSNNYLNIQEAGVVGKGNKNIRLEEIIISSNKNHLEELETGKLLSIKLRYKVKNNFNLSKARIDLRIDNQYNQRILWMSSESKSTFDFSKSEILFEFPKNPLLPGTYNLTVFIHDGVDVADWFSNVLTFSVDNSGELFNTLKIPNGQTNIYLPFEVL
ncbi:ABC transporter ATP-binding protein [Algoriphagus halophytocola]|uniref:ABC transporter ATP-binding protein n=1 Tax=Algoriphagus halophytocola TaxID=2991499 RepID=UPI0022DDF7C8|nr:ABC transporter ATP-binding protein [Algoriphagus sp. TR-M9]WBL41313.1 ABC transporter ATP-binding protein [Algoriphagus sp. TR-M9]